MILLIAYQNQLWLSLIMHHIINQKNLKNINCFSNEGNRWRDSKIKLVEENILIINFEEKFTSERGRINCSLNDSEGWRWLGVQYVISEY